MESEFGLYFKLGLEHIADPNAFDHIVFIVALCAMYKLSEWKKVAILVTAFTIGHSVTLALAALDIVRFPQEVIEFLIPVTILITAIYNVARPAPTAEASDRTFNRSININYLFALFFGLIHGMGFSNFFKSLMGGEASIMKPLFAFNVGIEAGQLMIVIVLLGIGYLIMNVLKVKQQSWTIFISGAAAGIALTLMIPFLTGAG